MRGAETLFHGLAGAEELQFRVLAGVAGGPVGDPGVAQFRRADALAVVEASVDDETSADACADVRVEELLRATAAADPVLAVSGGARVVEHEGRDPEAVLEPLFQAEIVPSLDLDRLQDGSCRGLQRSAEADADRPDRALCLSASAFAVSGHLAVFLQQRRSLRVEPRQDPLRAVLRLDAPAHGLHDRSVFPPEGELEFCTSDLYRNQHLFFLPYVSRSDPAIHRFLYAGRVRHSHTMIPSIAGSWKGGNGSVLNKNHRDEKEKGLLPHGRETRYNI